MVAEKIQAKIHELSSHINIELFNIKDTSLSLTEQFNTLIFGISTWDFGELQEDWESSWQDISSLNLAGKSVALFGLGDQIGYGDWFQDALGMLHDELAALGCEFVGYWPNEGYEFSQSKALIADGSYFVGLSVDDENQYELTDSRVEQWCAQILAELDAL